MCLTSCSFSCSEAMSPSSFRSLHLELAVLVTSKRRPAEVARPVRRQLVDEAAERAVISERPAHDVEGHAGKRADLRRTGRPRDLLAHAEERRQGAADPPDVPDPVELAHED